MPDVRNMEKSARETKHFLVYCPASVKKFIIFVNLRYRRSLCGGVQKVENARARRMRKYSFTYMEFSLIFFSLFRFMWNVFAVNSAYSVRSRASFHETFAFGWCFFGETSSYNITERRSSTFVAVDRRPSTTSRLPAAR